MNPQDVLQERYPQADFSVVFSFCEARRGRVKSKGMHGHHYCPVAQFPEFEFGYPENIIFLTIEEHIEVHKMLGKIDSAMNWPCAAWVAKASEGGRLGSREGKRSGGHTCALQHMQKGTGIFAPGMQAKGGSVSGILNQQRAKESRTGFFSSEHAGRGPHKRWHVNRGLISATCALCISGGAA